MRTTKDHQGNDRVILASFIEQKQTHRVKKADGTYVDLFMGFIDGSLNGWNFKPTVGRALTDLDEIKKGDFVLCPYMVFENDAMQLNKSDLRKGGIEIEKGEEAFSVGKDLCWMGLRDNKMYCIGDNMICRRIYEPEMESDLALVRDRRKHETYIYVEQMPEDPSKYEFDEMKMSDIKVGDIIAVRKMSDIEFKYVLNNEHKSLIRVNFSRDFLGFTHNELKYEF